LTLLAASLLSENHPGGILIFYPQAFREGMGLWWSDDF